MGNTASQRPTRSHTLNPKDSFDTENITEGENSSTPSTNNNNNSSSSSRPKREPMRTMGKKSRTGTTGMPDTKKALGYAASPARSKAAESDVEGRDDSVPRPQFIRDDQVQVNLAMADLMAYLQVVANNSNNLPLTRRDDPELTRMVSTLTSEEYARKSAAFIPADVRVLGGSFLKYGKVWDLPTSEEYTALDGAQEPGKHERGFRNRLCLHSTGVCFSHSFSCFASHRSIVWRSML